jgi:hypothetical protein
MGHASTSHDAIAYWSKAQLCSSERLYTGRNFMSPRLKLKTRPLKEITGDIHVALGTEIAFVAKIQIGALPRSKSIMVNGPNGSTTISQ